MEQHAIDLFNLYAHFPVALLALYGLTLFLPISASRCVATLIACAIAWGLFKHFDSNLKWWVDTWTHTFLVPSMNAPEGLEFMVREAYVRGFFTCTCIVLGILLIMLPWIASSYVRSAIAIRAKAPAKGSVTAL